MDKKWLSAVLFLATTASYAEQGVFGPADKDLLKKQNDSIAFAVIGDYGDDSVAEGSVAKRVDEQNPDFVLTLGDNNYSYGCWDTIDKNIGKYYSRFIGNYQGSYGRGAKMNQFYPSLGNHDWNAQGKCLYKGTLPYLSYFTLPDRGYYYDFRKGNVHFFALDSDSREPDGNKQGSRQYEWLKRKLKESDACFKVVFFHHPAYSSGEHGSQKDMQWDFADMGADMVLSGHDHDYERIMLDGIAYFVNGIGGADLYKFNKIVKGSAYRYNKNHGYMMGYARDNSLSFAFYNEDNELKDSITLKKNCS